MRAALIVPGGNVRRSLPTLPIPPVVAGSRSFAIGWIRKTSSQLNRMSRRLQLAPGPGSFSKPFPRPVVPSPVQRLPSLIESKPLVPELLRHRLLRWVGIPSD